MKSLLESINNSILEGGRNGIEELADVFVETFKTGMPKGTKKLGMSVWTTGPKRDTKNDEYVDLEIEFSDAEEIDEFINLLKNNIKSDKPHHFRVMDSPNFSKKHGFAIKRTYDPVEDYIFMEVFKTVHATTGLYGPCLVLRWRVPSIYTMGQLNREQSLFIQNISYRYAVKTPDKYLQDIKLMWYNF